MKLLLTGGGTLGSVTPLIAIAESLPAHARVFWIGTRTGVERTIVTNAQIPFFWIVTTKLRRYLDVRTLVAPLLLLVGFLHALAMLMRLRPTHVVGAGGYVAVPVISAAWVLRIPSYTIQLDVLPGLANRLVAPFVRKIFVTFSESAQYFSRQKTVVVGAPMRKSIAQVARRKQRAASRPNLLVIGGGTGSVALNQLIWEVAATLEATCDIVHLTGVGKGSHRKSAHYTQKELAVEDMHTLIANADIVLTRAGMGTLSELAALRKAAIVVPLPGSPQEENARVLAEQHAILLRRQQDATPEQLIRDVQTLLQNDTERERLGTALHAALPTDAVSQILKFILPS